MPTCTFKIVSGGSEFDFTVETDDSNNLTALTATEGSDTYRCKLLLVPDPSGILRCCTPDGCMSGPCSPD